jgi:hypothetical protein
MAHAHRLSVSRARGVFIGIDISEKGLDVSVRPSGAAWRTEHTTVCVAGLSSA